MCNVTDDEKYVFSTVVIHYIEMNGYDYIDGLVSFCDENGIDYEDVKDLISDKLYGYIQKQALEEKRIKRINIIE